MYRNICVINWIFYEYIIKNDHCCCYQNIYFFLLKIMNVILQMVSTARYINKLQAGIRKVYRLGGETNSAIRRRKRTPWRRREARGSSLLRTFLKLSLKMPSIFCEFLCYNRKLCVNKPTSFFSYNTGPNVNKKRHADN